MRKCSVSDEEVDPPFQWHAKKGDVNVEFHKVRDYLPLTSTAESFDRFSQGELHEHVWAIIDFVLVQFSAFAFFPCVCVFVYVRLHWDARKLSS